MSSLSNQHSSNPFSDYNEPCKVPTMSSAGPPQPWNWQDMGPPRGLVVGGGAPITDEDKLCFFEQPGTNADLKVPGRIGGVTGMSTRPSLGSTSLGSAGESPDSLSSASLSPSPAQMSSSQSGSSSSTMPRAMEETPTEEISPSESWDNADFGQSSPKVAMPQVASKHYPESSPNGSPLAGRVVEGSTGNNSEEEEDMEEGDLEPCFMNRAQIQRKAMRRAMSECTHLSVPASLDLSDKYPGEAGDEAEHQLVSPVGGPRRSPHSMKRSLTVAEEQPPTPVMSAAGTTHLDLRQSSPEPLHRLSPLPLLKDVNINRPWVEKELGGIVLPVPPSPKEFAGQELTSYFLHEIDEKVGTKEGFDLGGNKASAEWNNVGFASEGYGSFAMKENNTNPFITAEGS